MTLTVESFNSIHSSRFDREVIKGLDGREEWALGVADRHLSPILSRFDRSRFESDGHEVLFEELYARLLSGSLAQEYDAVSVSREDRSKNIEALKELTEMIALERIDQLIAEAVCAGSKDGLTQGFADSLANIRPSSEDSPFYLSTSTVKRQMDKWFNTAIDARSVGVSNHKDLSLAAMYYAKNTSLIPSHYEDTGSRNRVALVSGEDYRLQQAQVEYLVAANSDEQVVAELIEQYFKHATGVDIKQTYKVDAPDTVMQRFYGSAVKATRTAGAATLGLLAGAVPSSFATGLPQQISEIKPLGSVEVGETVVGDSALTSALMAAPSIEPENSTRGASRVPVQLEVEALRSIEVEPVKLGPVTSPTVVDVSILGSSGVVSRVEVDAIPKDSITGDNLSPEEKVDEAIKNGRPGVAADIIAESTEDSGTEVPAAAKAELSALVDSYKARLFELRKKSIVDSDTVIRANSAIAYLEAGMKNPSVLDNYLEVSADNDIPVYLAQIYAKAGSDEVLLKGIGREAVEQMRQSGSFADVYDKHSVAIGDLLAILNMDLLTYNELVRLYPEAMQASRAAIDERVEQNNERARLRILEERAAASESEHSELLQEIAGVRDAAVEQYFSEAIEAVRSSGSRFNPMDARDVIDIVKSTTEKYPHDVVNEEFMLAVLWQESLFDKDAESSAGAGGIGQFMPETAKEWIDGDRFDPVAAIDGSVRYYQFIYGLMQERFPDMPMEDLRNLTLAGYNAGPYRAAIREGRIPNIKETNDYIELINGLIGEITEAQDAAEGAERQAVEEAEREAEAARIAYEEALKESKTVGHSAALNGEKGVVAYYQTDPEWKDIPYKHPEAKDGTLGQCGCGPTSWASAVATLHRNDTNPAQVGESMMDLGAPASPDNCFSFHVWDFEHDHGNPAVLEREYNVIVERIDLSNDAFKETINAGGMIMMSQGPGEFTSAAGHLMLVTGMRNLEDDSPRTYFVMNPANEEQTNDPDGFTAKQLLENARHGHAWAIYKATPDEVETHIAARQQAADEREAERQRQAEEEARRAEEEARRAKEARSSAVDELELDRFPQPAPRYDTGDTASIKISDEVLPAADKVLDQVEWAFNHDGPIRHICDRANSKKDCTSFCGGITARVAGYENSGFGSAIEHYRAAEARGLINRDLNNVPAGAIVFWDAHWTNGNYGHVGIAIGDGLVASNISETGGYGPMSADWQGGALLGWADPSEVYFNSKKGSPVLRAMSS